MSASRPVDRSASIVVRELVTDDWDVAWSCSFLFKHAGDTLMVSRGQPHHCHRLPGFYTEGDGGKRTGLLTYTVDAEEMEVVALYVAEQGRGNGTALLEAAIGRARERGCRRVWLVTTNDNEPAIRFYRNRGMRLVAVHAGAVDVARSTLKPKIPLHGVGGTSIHDEIEFELVIDADAEPRRSEAGAPRGVTSEATRS
jgi:GNAT superfamily N-acetyltransferase